MAAASLAAVIGLSMIRNADAVTSASLAPRSVVLERDSALQRRSARGIGIERFETELT